jgi:hypothetical protein
MRPLRRLYHFGHPEKERRTNLFEFPASHTRVLKVSLSGNLSNRRQTWSLGPDSLNGKVPVPSTHVFGRFSDSGCGLKATLHTLGLSSHWEV